MASAEQVGAFASLAPEQRATIGECAHAQRFEAGDRLLRDGEPANAFYVIERGDVALETFVPQRGAALIETLHDGDLLGWSWLVPPYRVAFDARAVSTTETLAFDAACLRGKVEQDAALGYDLLRLFSGVIIERLQQTRLRLLDVYGRGGG